MQIELSKYEGALFYEIFIKEEYNNLYEHIKAAKTIFDIGGHIGLFSLYVMSIKYGLSPIIKENILDINGDYLFLNDFRIHYFEPVLENYSKAKKLLSEYENNITLNNCGISNIEGRQFIYKGKISTQSSIYRSFLNKGEQSEECNFINIGKYLESNQIKSIDILKMDIEGAEFDVLLNLSDEIYHKIHIIFIEYHIINDDLGIKYNKLLTKLKKYYIDIKITESEYNSRIGYIYCKN